MAVGMITMAALKFKNSYALNGTIICLFNVDTNGFEWWRAIKWVALTWQMMGCGCTVTDGGYVSWKIDTQKQNIVCRCAFNNWDKYFI